MSRQFQTPERRKEMVRKKKMNLQLKEGALHKQLGVKKGEKIPAGKEEIKPGDSALTRKRKQFAINAKKWNHHKMPKTGKPVHSSSRGKKKK